MAALLVSGGVLYYEELSSVGCVSAALFSLVFWSAEIGVWLIITRLTGEGMGRRDDATETVINIPPVSSRDQSKDDEDS